jgi:hypothetical protein
MLEVIPSLDQVAVEHWLGVKFWGRSLIVVALPWRKEGRGGKERALFIF